MLPGTLEASAPAPLRPSNTPSPESSNSSPVRAAANHTRQIQSFLFRYQRAYILPDLTYIVVPSSAPLGTFVKGKQCSELTFRHGGDRILDDNVQVIRQWIRELLRHEVHRAEPLSLSTSLEALENGFRVDVFQRERRSELPEPRVQCQSALGFLEYVLAVPSTSEGTWVSSGSSP